MLGPKCEEQDRFTVEGAMLRHSHKDLPARAVWLGAEQRS